MNLKEIRERIGVRPWRAVALLIGFAVVVFVVVPLARYSGVLDSLGFTCDAEEKAILVEFPQYGGRVVGKDIKGPLGGEVLNFPPLQEPPPGCALELSARHASPKQVAAYYEKQLTEHGWKVERFPVSPDPQSEEPGDFIYPTLMVLVTTYATRFTIGPRAYTGARRWLIFRQMLSTERAQECTFLCTDNRRSVILPASTLSLLINFDQYH
jgi:hypothetical protein